MSYDPAILLLGTYLTKPKKLIQNSTSTPMFIAALFTVVKIWKQPSAISRWVDKTAMGHLHNVSLLYHEKEENLTLCDSMDGPGEHYAQ